MNQKIFLCFTFFLILLGTDIHAQETQIYKGKYNLQNVGEGLAEYHYFIKQKDTIFEGEFSFSNLVETSGNNSFESISYNGSYKKNKMQGDWVFSFKAIDSVGKLRAKDFDLVSTTSGEEFLVKGFFDDHEQKDTWKVIRRCFNNSKPTDTSLTAEIDFGRENLKENFSSTAKNISVDGVFDNNGMIDGDWIIIHNINNTEIKEVRKFENGVLTNHYFSVNNEKIFVDYLGLDMSKNANEKTWSNHDFNELYTEVLKIANISSYTLDEFDVHLDDLSQISLDFIKKTFLSSYKHNDIAFWDVVSQKAIDVDHLTVSLRKYPLSIDEKKAIKSIKSDFVEIQNKISKFNDESLVEIGLHQYETLKTTNEIYKIISENLVDLKHNVDISQSKALPYLDRSSLDNRIFKTIEFPNKSRTDFQNETLIIETNLPSAFNPLGFELPVFASFISSIKQRVTELDSASDFILDDLKKQSKLNEIEDKLVSKKDSILKFYKANENDEKFNKYHEAVAFEIIKYTKEQFEAYASLEIDEKKRKIDFYLDCFDEIISLYKMQAELPSKIERIKDLYTRTVWNPYTYTDMKETVKERIYESFDEILLPHLLEKFNNEIDCESISKNIKNFNNLYNRMVELREQDTKQIEKALKREKNPMLIFEILSVNYTE
ncbi:hypothetical protein [Psychroflexus aestuariivivens]|uniref:hypothetical protein n=1 Tax=Psychroflexus aestuariivivens TaxID=1795040 RepID=UPI001864C27C|nr:hypothetical protein [Psychroflexus aestuariivivens]